MKRHEIQIGLGVLAVSVVLLSSLWGYLTTSTLYSRPGVGQGPYNPYATQPNKAMEP